MKTQTEINELFRRAQELLARANQLLDEVYEGCCKIELKSNSEGWSVR